MSTQNTFISRFVARPSYAWIVWAVAALFYSYEFFLRISPGVMTSELMHTFLVDATTLGVLSGFYYYAYASMQIPVGILLDRFGIKRLLSIAVLFVTLGCVLFSTAQQLWVAELGRVLMGLGSAFSFIGCLKLISNWFDAKKLAMVIGLTNTLGVMGAINGEAPLALLVDNIGWRQVMFVAAIVGIVIVALVSVLIYDRPPSPLANLRQDKTQPQHFWDGIVNVIKSRRTWLVAIVGGLMVAPVSAFTELWSVPFLQLEHHVAKPQAALLASLMFVGIAVGGPVHGLISGRLGRRKPVIWLGALGALLCLSSIIYLPINNIIVLTGLLFLFGFFTSSMLLCFAINTEFQPSWATGVTVGFTNMLVMLGGTLFQPLVGYLLDNQWHGKLLAGTRVFSLHDYQLALSLLPLCLIAALIVIPFIRETFCHSFVGEKCQ
ncbi:MAG: MFS transporter [Gammaproteobacteria bacterium]|nr:MFS transporter [Gammaproteobacteria bacterium]